MFDGREAGGDRRHAPKARAHDLVTGLRGNALAKRKTTFQEAIAPRLEPVNWFHELCW
jgi:hypothetical protein